MLAGGRGERIGGEKALLSLAGRPLAGHVIAAVRAAGLTPIVIAKEASRLEGLELGPGTIEREPDEPRHPLLGIAVALARHPAPLVVCPCDLPLIPAALLAHLAARPEPHVALLDAPEPQPLVGRFSPSAAPVLLAAAGDGLSAREAVAALDPAVPDRALLERFGDPGQYLHGVNTEADLREVGELLAGPAAPRS